MKINKLLESKKLKEGITNTEPVVKFQGKSSHTFTKDKKWEVDFDEAGNILARTRHGKPSYFKGHINDKVNDFPSTDEDNIILAAREQHGLKFGNKEVKEDWYEDHLDTMQRKTSGYDKCYKIVKKARTSNPIDTNALNDARDHFGYDLYKMCLDDALKEMDNLDEAFKPSNSGIQSVKCYNRYNYTIQELRVDNDNKTFERGNFTAGKADKKTKNRQEFEDVVDTLKELGYTEIKSDYRSMRNKSRKGNPTSVEEGYELSPRIDYNPNHLRDDEGKIMADRWYASKWPDDEVGIEQLKGLTLDDALKDRSILGHCDTQVRERVYAQLDKYIPLSVDSPMYKEKNESKSIKEARRKASDPKQIEKAEKSMLDSLMNGAYNTEWMIQDAKMIYGISYDEAVKAFRNAHNKYMIMSGELDESKESEESELITQYINNGEFDKLEKVHNGTNVVWKLKEPINSIDESKSLNEFAYKTDDLKAFYNTSNTIDKEKYPNFFVWYDEMVKSGKIKVNEEVKDNEKINEASYGGAFDIADDQYFTRDDLNGFAEEVLNHINETFKTPFDVSSCYIDNGILELCVTSDEYGDYIYSEKIDMRKIKEPWHLKRAYAFEFASQLINDITQSNDGLVESFDDDVDDLSYYYSEEDIIDALNDVWEEIASKSVSDSDGFMTDYTMYRNINTGEYVFVFGDKDIYRPEDGYFDWECETEEEAKEWFDNYNGFDESDDDIDWMNEEAEGESPILHKKGDGSYLVASENGDGYTAFNKSDVCMGHITANNEQEAKNKFNSNQFDENLNK